MAPLDDALLTVSALSDSVMRPLSTSESITHHQREVTTHSQGRRWWTVV